MKHAGSAVLDVLEPLLEAIRTRAGLIERSRGVFYKKGKAWLHFHEDAAGLFADLKVDGDWLRIEVTDEAAWEQLLSRLDEQFKRQAPSPSQAG